MIKLVNNLYKQQNKYLTEMVKESSNGVFWVIDDKLYSFPFYDSEEGVAKSGNTFNHKKLWPHINPGRSNIPYNYYPRGRVVISTSGKSTIYANPNISNKFLSQIKIDFGLRDNPRWIIDNSEHYKCYLDDNWKPDR